MVDRVRGWVRPRRADLACSAALVVLALLFLWRPLLTSDVLLPVDYLGLIPPWQDAAAGVAVHNDLIGDQILQNYQWKTFARDQLLAGQPPLWNPYALAGTPFLAEGQHGALYPLGFAFYLLPVEQAYEWFTALHLALAGLFMFALLRQLGTRWWGALVGAVAFQFTSFLVVSFLWPMILSAAVWAPLLLLLVDKVAAEPGVHRRGWTDVAAWGALGAVALAAQLLAGHLEISFYVLFMMAAWAGFRLVERLVRQRQPSAVVVSGLALSGMVAVGFALAAPLLLPFLELIGLNFRSGLRGVDTVLSYALPIRHLAIFLVPDVFGNPATHSWFDVAGRTVQPFMGAVDPGGAIKDYPFWGIKNYVEGAGYVGIPTLLLAGLALAVRRTAVTWFFTGLAIFALLLAFGSPLYAVFFTLVPGFTQLNTPFRWLFPVAVCAAVLAGLAADRIAARNFTLRGARPAVGAVGWAAFVGGAALVGLGVVALLAPAVVGPWFERLRDASDLATRAFPQPGSFFGFQLRNLLVAAGFLLLGGGLLIVAARGTRPAPWLGVALAAAVTLDLFVSGGNFNTVTSPDRLQQTPAAIAWLQQAQASQGGRSVTFDREGQRPLFPITWTRFGIEDVRGYDTVILKRYVEFWSLLEPPQGIDASMIHSLREPESLTSPLLDLLGVRWIVTTQNIGLSGLREVFRGDGVVIYENLDALPRAFSLPRSAGIAVPDESAALAWLRDHDPRTTVPLIGSGAAGEGRPARPLAQTVVSHAPQRVELAVAMPEDGWLILGDSWFAGWRAFVDGSEVPVLQAASILRAVELPAGEHRVEFRYSPESWRLGAVAALIGGVLVGLALVLWGWRRWVRPISELSTAQRVARNSITPMAAQLVSRGLDFAFAIITLRYLGPVGGGQYAFAVLVIGFFLLFVDYGLGTLLTREVARSKQDAEHWFANSVTLRLILWVLSMPLLTVVVVVYAVLFDLAPAVSLTLAVFAVSIIPSAIASSLAAVFSAFERFEIPAAVGIVTNVVRVSLGTVALFAGYGIVGLAGVSIVANVATVVIFFFLVRAGHFTPRLGFDWRFQLSMVRTAWPLMINNFLSTIFFRFDVLLLRAFLGDLAVGYYTTAYKFIDGLNIIPSLFTLAAFPVMSRLAMDARERLLFAYRFSLKLLIIASLPIATLVTVIGPALVTAVFGAEFAPAGVILQVVVWFLPFSFVNSLTHYVLIAANQQQYLTRAFLIGAVFNISANLWAIPTFGVLGAAVVTILSEIVLLIPFLIGIRRHVGSTPLLGVVLRPAIASAIMLAVLLLLGSLNIVLLSLAGGAVYLAAIVLLRGLDREEWALVRSLLQRGQSAPAAAEAPAP